MDNSTYRLNRPTRGWFSENTKVLFSSPLRGFLVKVYVEKEVALRHVRWKVARCLLRNKRCSQPVHLQQLPDCRLGSAFPSYRRPGSDLNMLQETGRLLVHSVQYTMYSVQYTMYSVQYTVYSVQYTVLSTQCTVHRTQCTVHSVQYTMYSIQCTIHSVQYTVYTTQCTLYTVYSVHYTVYSTPCTVHSVKYTVYSTQCTDLIKNYT